jgi:hypothetical protein
LVELQVSVDCPPKEIVAGLALSAAVGVGAGDGTGGGGDAAVTVAAVHGMSVVPFPQHVLNHCPSRGFERLEVCPHGSSMTMPFADSDRLGLVPFGRDRIEIGLHVIGEGKDTAGIGASTTHSADPIPVWYWKVSLQVHPAVSSDMLRTQVWLVPGVYPVVHCSGAVTISPAMIRSGIVTEFLRQQLVPCGNKLPLKSRRFLRCPAESAYYRRRRSSNSGNI